MNNKFSLLLLGSALYVLISGFFLCAKTNVLVGAQALSFSLPDENGQSVSLSDERFKKKRIALAFYPKNNSPYCTREVCALKDGFKVLEENNIVVLGISYGSIKKNRQFKNAYTLPFSLLSDKDKSVAKLYDAYSGIFKYFMPKRKTILIDEDRKIVAILDSVDVNNHADQIVKAFEKK